jgi:hypothetical protein
MVQFNDTIKFRIIPREERMANFGILRKNLLNIRNAHLHITNIINRLSNNKIFIVPDDEPIRINNPDINWSYDLSPIEFLDKLKNNNYCYYFIKILDEYVKKNIPHQSIGNLIFKFDIYMIRIYSILHN